MGIIAARVRFDGALPDPPTIRTALETRTGLTCQVTRYGKGEVLLARCKEFPASVELHVTGDPAVVQLEQGIGKAAYFFHQLQEALVDLGGCRCDLRGNRQPDGAVPSAPALWRDRRWSERFFDSHPFVTALVWLMIVVPKSLVELLRGREKT